MESVGWPAVAMIARQRNNQRGGVVAVTVRMLSQSSPLLMRPGRVARHTADPLLAALQGHLCARLPLLLAFAHLHVPQTKDCRTSPCQEPWWATSYARLLSRPPWDMKNLLDGAVGQVWSRCPSHGLLVCTQPEAERRPCSYAC